MLTFVPREKTCQRRRNPVSHNPGPRIQPDSTKPDAHERLHTSPVPLALQTMSVQRHYLVSG